MFCPKCAAELNWDALSCPNCGRDLPLDMLVSDSQMMGSETLEYFQVPLEPSPGLCSDPQCPCPEVTIPRGDGYLYILEETVEFRRDARTSQELARKIQRMEEQSNHLILLGHGMARPILVCELGANLRNLDLEVAAADARRWWQTGLVPLRPTPVAGVAGDSADINYRVEPSERLLRKEGLATRAPNRSQSERGEVERVPCSKCGYMTLTRIIEQTDGICKRCQKFHEVGGFGTLAAMSVTNAIFGALLCGIIWQLVSGKGGLGALMGIVLGIAYGVYEWASLKRSLRQGGLV